MRVTIEVKQDHARVPMISCRCIGTMFGAAYGGAISWENQKMRNWMRTRRRQALSLTYRWRVSMNYCLAPHMISLTVIQRALSPYRPTFDHSQVKAWKWGEVAEQNRYQQLCGVPYGLKFPIGDQLLMPVPGEDHNHPSLDPHMASSSRIPALLSLVARGII